VLSLKIYVSVKFITIKINIEISYCKALQELIFTEKKVLE